MGIEKLLENLKDYLDKGERKKKAHCERIDFLLDKLEEKEKKLKHKLEKEKSASKRKHIKTELKIISVQLKKGISRRGELRKKCK